MGFLSRVFGSTKRSSTTDHTHKAWNPPSPSNDEDYVRRCLQAEFQEEPEKRAFRDDSAFAEVLEHLNARRYDKAIMKTTPLLSKYRDFDLPYFWLGSAYREAGQLEPSRTILAQGVMTTKRKLVLLTDIGETEWQMGNIEAALYAWSQALHCLSANPIDHNAYLLLSYVAQGIGLTDESRAFLARVDELRGGQVRLDPQMASRLTNLASTKQSEAMRRVIVGLQKRYVT